MNPTIYLFQKWAYRVKKDWYGFSLGNAPFEWATEIDEFLEWVEANFPDFKILQIKLKMGGLRCYLDLGLPDTLIHDSLLKEYNSRRLELENKLFTKRLIY